MASPKEKSAACLRYPAQSIPAWVYVPVRYNPSVPASLMVFTRTERRSGKTGAVKGTLAAIRRRWKSGDTIHLRLPLSFRTQASTTAIRRWSPSCADL
jgi:hypothetical protein